MCKNKMKEVLQYLLTAVIDTDKVHSPDKDVPDIEIRAAGSAPRVTEEDVDNAISYVKYTRAPESTLTICIIYLKNGTTVTGESACVSPENFNTELGEKMAYKKARDKVWQLEGYLLAQHLHNLSLVREAGDVKKDANCGEAMSQAQPSDIGSSKPHEEAFAFCEEIEEVAQQIGSLISRMNLHFDNHYHGGNEPNTSPHRWMNIARTDLQTGVMALRRAMSHQLNETPIGYF